MAKIGDLSITVEDIGPEEAEKYLSGNTHNRPVRQKKVEKYAIIAREGKWKLTHQGIAFTEDGTLIDGQHRLMAIWWLWTEHKVRVTAPMMVTRGLPIGTQLVVDDHEKRSVLDVGRWLRGLQDMTKAHVSAARVIWVHGLGMDKSGINNERMVEFIKKHFDGLDFVVRDAMGNHRKGVSQAGVLAALTQAYYTGAKPEQLRRFGEILNGAMALPEEQAAHSLRNWLVERPNGMGGNAGQVEVYRKTQRALRSFLDGKPLTKIYIPRENLFPMAQEGRKRG